jgi:4-diphosphocytidyl-2-C-methyl-D-erythritol kinase
LQATFSHKGRRSSPPRISERLSLAIEGPFAADLKADESDNLILRAARALADRYGVAKGAHLTLDKRLPIASGIGGGSADAAVADLRALAGELGADVPACLLSRTMRGAGRGDALTPWEHKNLAGTPLLLVNPNVAASTAKVFARWDGLDCGPLPDDPAEGRNDLERPAMALVPDIADVLAALRACAGVGLARMSGSGATCFALFEDEAARDAAAAEIAAANPGWWQLATRLREA